MLRRSLSALLLACALTPSAHAAVPSETFGYAGIGAAPGAGSRPFALDTRARDRFDARDLLAGVATTLTRTLFADNLLRPTLYHDPNGYFVGLQLRIPLK